MDYKYKNKNLELQNQLGIEKNKLVGGDMEFKDKINIFLKNLYVGI